MNARWLTAAGHAVLVVLAVVTAGCSGGHSVAATVGRPVRPAARSHSQAPVPVTTPAPTASTPTPTATAPAPGTVLATQPAGGNDLVEPITDGSGFAVLADTFTPATSNITVYDVAGQQEAVISRGFDADCGATDVLVPGAGRLIIAERIAHQAAQGIHGGSSSLDLIAWRAASGSVAWTSPVLPSAPAGLSCTADGPFGYAVGAEDLNWFAMSNDGRWGIFAAYTGNPVVVNLRNGAVQVDRDAIGALGSFIVNGCQEGNGTDLDTLIAPSTGRAEGYFLSLSQDANQCTGTEAASRGSGPSLDNLNGGAPTGMFSTDSAGTSPSDGLTSDDAGVLIDNAVENGGPIARYTLPGMQLQWRRGGDYYMWGDAGGLVVASDDGRPGQPLAGINDTTGTIEWVTPISGSDNSGVCDITSSQILYAVGSQLAVLSMKTGKQLSYSANPDAADQDPCPITIPGGIGLQFNGSGVTVSQELAP